MNTTKISIPVLLKSFLFLCISIGISFTMLQIGCCPYSISDCIGILYHPLFLVTNFAVLLLLFLLLWGVTGTIIRAALTLGVVAFLLSIVNVYVVYFHGDVFTFSLLKDIQTALSISTEYSFVQWIQLKYVLLIIFLLAIQIAFAVLYKKNCDPQNCSWAVIRCSLAIVATSLLVVGNVQTFSENGFLAKQIQDARISTWNQSGLSTEYGYISMLLTSPVEITIDPLENYNRDLNVSISEDSGVHRTSDVILILNESFCDLSAMADFETSVDVLSAFYGIENAIYGNVLVEQIGGGTNISEYELLTSNSLSGMSYFAPFNHLDLSASSSIVSVLKELGYYCIASHCQTANNYNRRAGYAQLGFDKSYFIEDHSNIRYWGNKIYATDEYVYENLIQWYEENTRTETPLFLYTVTIQNHGGYSQNDKNCDTVSVTGLNGAITDQVEEYLSGVQSSAKAFRDLCQYFETQERDVIICMVGDHSATLATQVGEKNNDIEYSISRRTVPFCIWANFDLSVGEEETQIYRNMTSLVPYLSKQLTFSAVLTFLLLIKCLNLRLSL